MTAGLVSIGMVTWNSAGDLPSCLESLRQQAYSPIELIVVDNGSTDASVPLIQERFPQARVIRNSANEGYCRAHNQAIREARGEHYMALNPDVQLQPDFIQRLAAALEAHPDCGSAVGKFHQPPKGTRPTLDGAAPLDRMRMLDELRVQGEYYDEAFFAYMEDVDLAWRARLMGWRRWYEPRAVAVHVRSFKPGRRKPIPRRLRRLAIKNRHLTILKNEAGDTYRRDWWRIHLYDLQILAYLLLLEQSSLPAYWLLRRHWSRALRWRREIWRRARATPEECRAWSG